MIQRLEAYLTFVMTEAKSNPNTSKKARFFMEKIIGEVMEELADVPADIIEDQFARTTNAVYWVATGQEIQNMPMPLGFREAVVSPELTTPISPKAIESGAVSE